MDQPFIYQIRVQGQLDTSWSDWLSGLAIASQANGETVLIGSVQDQAALHGILDQLYGMNLPLISVLRVDQHAGIQYPYWTDAIADMMHVWTDAPVSTAEHGPPIDR